MALSNPAATIIGAGISAGSSVLGGYMSNMYSKKAAKRAYRYQRKLLSNQIQWKVADAKKAGIHPLYALGAQSASYSSPIDGGPNPGEGIMQAGQAIGGAVSRIGGRGERKEQALRNQLLAAQIGETDARTQAIQSETARNLQNAQSQVAGAEKQLGIMDENSPSKVATVDMGPQFIYEYDLNFKNDRRTTGLPDLPGAGLVERVPPQIPTHKKGDRGVTAGESASMREYRLPSGLPILLPQSGEGYGESLENTPFWMWPSIIQMNKRKYGEQWGADFMEYLLTGGAPWHQKYNQ